jgi:hypothetical protein
MLRGPASVAPELATATRGRVQLVTDIFIVSLSPSERMPWCDN